jgi:PAS domain-containing protein
MQDAVEAGLRIAAYAIPVIGGLYAGWRVIRRPVGEFIAGMAAIPNLGGMADDIRAIRKEVTTNGGGSLKDMVRRVELHGHRREAMLRSHFANQNEGQFQADADGNLEWANETLQRWTGRPEHALHNRAWYSIIATGQQDEFRQEFERAIAEKREFRGQCHIRSITPVTDSGGGREKHLATDWRVVVVRDASDPKLIHGYAGNVRLRHPTAPHAAMPRVETGD